MLVSLLALSLAPAPMPQDCDDPPWLVRVGPSYAGDSLAYTFTTITDGLNYANQIAPLLGGTVPKVLVDPQPGGYFENLVLPANDVILEGDRFDPCSVVIDGSLLPQATVRIDSGQTGATRVIGFTIRGGTGERRLEPMTGTTSVFGGGISIENASPTIEWNVIRDNTAISDDGGTGQGGGLFAFQSSACIHHNIFRGNETSWMGGGLCLDDCTASVTENHFVDEVFDCETSSSLANTSGLYGGAIGLNEGDQSVIRGNLLRANRADLGGGISIRFSDSIVEGNTILDSQINLGFALWGGGIFTEFGTPTIHSNVIAYNGTHGGTVCEPYNSGGGIFVGEASGSGPALIVNNTIWGNAVDATNGEGGGIYVWESGWAEIRNNILWDNTGSTIGAAPHEQVYISNSPLYTTVQSNNASQTPAANDLPGIVNPELKDPQGYDFHLKYGSLLRDAGEAITGLAVADEDFEGDPRAVDFDGADPMNPPVRDVGADEYENHVYYVGEILPPTLAGGAIRVVGTPGAQSVVYVSPSVLSPGFEVPFGVGGQGGDWWLGVNNPVECDFEEPIFEVPLFLAYHDGGPLPSNRVFDADGFTEYLTPQYAAPFEVVCPFSLYLQAIVGLEPTNTLKRVTNVERLTYLGGPSN